MENRSKEVYQYDISVQILEKCISIGYFPPREHSGNFGGDSLFVLSDEDIKIIEIVKKEYNWYDKTLQVYIVEEENDYAIIHFDAYSRYQQLIDKKTFAKGFSSHKEKIPQSNSGNFKEIK